MVTFEGKSYTEINGVSMEVDLYKMFGICLDGPNIGEEVELTEEQFYEAWKEYNDQLLMFLEGEV